MLNTKIKAIIFDMDGVILDSEPLHEIARQRMFHRLQITPDESFPKPVGNSASGYWRQVCTLCQINEDAYDLQAEQYRLVAEQIAENHVPVSDGVLDIFSWAKEHGVKIGLASSSTRPLVDETLQLLGVYDYFDCTVSGDEVAHKKPEPDIYLKALELLGCSNEQAVAIEDTTSGIKAAVCAGIFCYGYENPTSGPQDLSQASAVVTNLKQVIE